MLTYSGKNKPNSTMNIWSKGLSIELRILRLITLISLHVE